MGSSPHLLAAFATSDLQNIDEHFGSATRFAIFRVSAELEELVNVIAFDPALQDGNENKLAAKIAALQGCAAVFCQACGGSAVRQLMAQQVQPIKVDASVTIESTLAYLRGELANPTVAWIAKAVARSTSRDESRFASMASEGWQE